MANSRDPHWTIDELGSRTALALAVDYEGAPNDRVRDVPDRRTIRYYTTLGLIDRPAALRGRTALYGARHLLQLVAIKRLQARGASLSEVQTRLVGLTDSALREIARLPADFEETPSSSQQAEEDHGRRAGPFWGAAPASPVEAPAKDDEARDEEPRAGVRSLVG